MLFCAVARVRLRMMQSVFIPHNFHVRKEYALHHLKPLLASLDGATTDSYHREYIFLSIFFLSIYYY
jgi:hypothetical protein